MNEVTVFCHEMFGEIRVIDSEGDPWFVAKDICDALGLVHVTNALASLDEDELTVAVLQSGGQTREMRLISEPGLYALVLRSRKPEARDFKRWVTHDVLREIRKTGGYRSQPSEKDLMQASTEDLLKVCVARISHQDQVIEEQSAEIVRCNKIIAELRKNSDKQVRCLRAIEEGLLDEIGQPELSKKLNVGKSLFEKGRYIWRRSPVMARAVIEDSEKLSLRTAEQLIREATDEQREIIEKAIVDGDESDVVAAEELMSSILYKAPSKERVIYKGLLATIGETAVEGMYEQFLGNSRTLFE